MDTYRVTGPFPFRGNAPGSTFEADPDERIERAVKRGSIAPAETPPTAASTPAGTTPAAPASTASTDTSPKPSASHAGHAGGHQKKE